MKVVMNVPLRLLRYIGCELAVMVVMMWVVVVVLSLRYVLNADEAHRIPVWKCSQQAPTLTG